MFTGRVVQPGEPEFLPEDTDGAIALAEEERATCSQCGSLKSVCRNPEHQFDTFEVVEEQCHVTYAIGAHRARLAKERDEVTQRAVQASVRFKPGKQPDMLADLDLAELQDQEDGGDSR